MLAYVVKVKDSEKASNLLNSCEVIEFSSFDKTLLIKGEEGLDQLLRYDPNVLQVMTKTFMNIPF